MKILETIKLRMASGDRPAGTYSGPFPFRAPIDAPKPRVILTPVSSVPDYDSTTRRWTERLQVGVYAGGHAEAIAVRAAWEAWIERGPWEPFGMRDVDAAPTMRTEVIDEEGEGYYALVDMNVVFEEPR